MLKAVNQVRGVKVVSGQRKNVAMPGDTFEATNQKEADRLVDLGVAEVVDGGSSKPKSTARKSAPKSEPNKVEQKDNGDDLGLGDDQK